LLEEARLIWRHQNESIDTLQCIHPTEAWFQKLGGIVQGDNQSSVSRYESVDVAPILVSPQNMDDIRRVSDDVE